MLSTARTMSTPDDNPESAKPWSPLGWPVVLFLLMLLCYVLSTGPVCRWSFPTARKIYAPLNPLVNSSVFGPPLRKWLSVWGAVPWWGQAFTPGRQQWFWSRIADGNTVINEVPWDSDVAKLRQAAEAGDAVAQLQLGTRLYETRHGLTTNNVEAYKWATIAASNGQPAAKYLVREMDLFLTPKEVADGKAAARSFGNARAGPKD